MPSMPLRSSRSGLWPSLPLHTSAELTMQQKPLTRVVIRGDVMRPKAKPSNAFAENWRIDVDRNDPAGGLPDAAFVTLYSNASSGTFRNPNEQWELHKAGLRAAAA